MGGDKKIIQSENKIPTCEVVKFKKRDFWFSLYLGLEIGLLFFLVIRFLKPDFILTIKGIAIPPWAIAIFLPIFSFIAILTAFKLGEKFRILCQIGKFGFVGVGNTLVDVFVLNSLMLLFGVPESAYLKWLLMAISFLVAMIHSFGLNKFWTFGQKETKKTGQEFAIFLTISFIGLAIHTIIATGVASALIAKSLFAENISMNIGKLIGVMFSLVWNFIGYKLIVFKKK